MPGDRGLAFVVIGVIATALLWLHGARARETHAVAYSASASAVPRDAQYLRRAAQAGLAGAFLSELAERREGSSVQNLARLVSRDFIEFNADLLRIASGRGVEIPIDQLNRETRARYERLADLDGAEFDRLWASRALEMHGDAMSALESEASSGSYPEVKRFAEQSLPTVRNRIVLIRNTVSEARRFPGPQFAGLQSSNGR